MNIKSAEFVKSAVKVKDYPNAVSGEIAFAGRSNVGKSSLINAILNRRQLAKTGSTPGKTRTINFFLIDEDFYFVDLPGYGYAKVSRTMRQSWSIMVENYLKAERPIKALVLIIDIRRDPGDYEMTLVEWLNYYRIPVVIVLTKADKLSGNKRAVRVREIARLLNIEKEEAVLFSARTREGSAKLWEYLIRFLEK